MRYKHGRSKYLSAVTSAIEANCDDLAGFFRRPFGSRVMVDQPGPDDPPAVTLSCSYVEAGTQPYSQVFDSMKLEPRPELAISTLARLCYTSHIKHLRCEPAPNHLPSSACTARERGWIMVSAAWIASDAFSMPDSGPDSPKIITGP